MAYLFLATVTLYIVSAFGVMTNRHLARIAFRRALMEDRNRIATSLAWAWISFTEILAAQQYWGSARFGNITDYPKPRIWRLFLPHKLPFVAATVLYQHLMRHGSAFGSGYCPSTPNCSNYFLGCLSRYGLVTSLAKAHIRTTACSGHPDISFTENFM